MVTVVRRRLNTGIWPLSRGTKIAAWIRSSGRDARDSDPSTKSSVLTAMLHKTP